jgi:hypothetical protein
MVFKSGEHAFAGTRSALAVLLLLASGFLSMLMPDARAAGLFGAMAGSWRGDGSIEWNTGERERMRCTAKYEVEREGNRIKQDLTCATDSTRLVVKSTITFNPAAGAITGTWSETSYGINGVVSGTASTGSVKALVRSTDNRFRARVTVITAGKEQSVSIVPEGIDVDNVSVKLRRG